MSEQHPERPDLDPASGDDPMLGEEADRLNDAVSDRPPVEQQVAEQGEANRP